MAQDIILTEDGIETTTIEMERLVRWLVDHGHTYEEACECIAYMSATADA